MDHEKVGAVYPLHLFALAIFGHENARAGPALQTWQRIRDEEADLARVQQVAGRRHDLFSQTGIPRHGHLAGGRNQHGPSRAPAEIILLRRMRFRGLNPPVHTTTARGRFLKGGRSTAGLIAVLFCCRAVHAQAITERLTDPRAVYLDAPEFKARGDGVADDTGALQAAINAVQESIRRGIVFVPEGRYRITHPVYVWAGIRLIGFGAKRPAFVLADRTPGYQGDGSPGGGGPKYMLQFVSEPPRRPGEPVADGNPGTFYSAMNGINIEIEIGRAHV